MRGLLFISLICICAPALAGQERRPARQPEMEQRVYEALNGRSIVTRVYLDPQADLGRFEKVSIPVADGLIKFGAIKSAYPSISDSAVILIWARDQTDTVVAETLGRHMYMSRHFEKYEPSLQFLATSNDYSPSWTFVDARGEPIPKASVEVAACAHNAAMDDIPLYKATLDEQARLPRFFGPTFKFRIEHPNYGIATVFYMNSKDDPCGVYVVPLVPRDSDAFAAAAQGNVIDSDGNPVAEASVSCTEVVKPDGTREYPYQRILSRSVTDANGWFALCLPTLTKDFELGDPPPAGTQYLVEVEPPKESNLRSPQRYRPIPILAGSGHTFTLPRMDSDEYFHTFAFEFQEGPITSPEELKNVKLGLSRDDRPWRALTYEQWKNGCSLPLGVLHASTKRWGDDFGFEDAVLTADSPTHVVVKARRPILYRGRVVDGDTGEPVAGVLVLADHECARKDPCSLTDDQWRQLHDQVVRDAADRTPEALYRMRNRATMTGADGVYELTFMPGFNAALSSFTAMAPNHRRAFAGSFYLPPNADGIVELPTIKLSPLDSRRPFPTFIFHDETGPVTDPAKLKDIKVEVRSFDGRTSFWQYEVFMSERQFTPGVYGAEVMWDRKYYTFESMDLSRDRPETVTFRPAKIEKVDVVYEGSVVHGVTGKPVAGAIVLHRRLPTEHDTSSLTAEQWAAIGTLGPQMNTTDPALAPLMNVLVQPGIPAAEMVPHLTKTDSNGRFTLSSDLGVSSPAEELLAVARDYLGTRQRLAIMVRTEANVSGPRQRQRLEADDKGVVSLPPMKLFPAATVLVHPVLPDPGFEDRAQRVRLYWRVPDQNRPLWVDDLFETGMNGLGAGVFRQYEVQPNVTQTVHVPAGVSLDLTLYVVQLRQTPWPPVPATSIRLQQGQVTDLGRLELKPGIQVTVKVLDSTGNPVPGVRIGCVGDDGLQWMATVFTDARGTAMWGVPAHSTGRFRVVHVDRQTRTPTEESIPYFVAGDEDAGKEFTLRLSDALLRMLDGPAERAPGSLPAPSPASNRRQ